MKRISLFAGPIAGTLFFILLRAAGFEHPMAGTAALTTWMAIWWLTEAVDLGVTSLLPFVFLPALGILDAATVAGQYMEQTIFLFMGGFFLAFAMEKWSLHERLAYNVVRLTGGTPVRVLAGIMATTFFISMWISNTATTLLMLTAVLAIIRHEFLFDEAGREKMATGYLLALTYSASIGGLSTLVGTPTNMILVGFTEKLYTSENPLTFLGWFRFSFPFALLLLSLLFLFLRKRYFKQGGNRSFDMAFIDERLKQLGKTGREERVIIFVFMLTVTAWFTRSTINFGTFRLPGWTNLLPYGSMIKDSTVAIFASLLLFLWPARSTGANSILGWEDVQKLPLRILLLFGSGFALAEAFQQSGLSSTLAEELVVLKGMPRWVFTLGIGILITIISEFASNVACIQLMLPVLSALAVSVHMDPLVLMIPATLAASFGFMMPVATAPNTIVYGTGYVPVREMMRTGLLLNILAVSLLTVYTALFY